MMKTKMIVMVLLLQHAIVHAQSNNAIAVLPFNASIQGNVPKRFSVNDIEIQKENLSKAKQNEMVNYLNFMNHKKKNRNKQVHILSAEEINAVMRENNISTEGIYAKTDAELQQLFNAKYIVKGNIAQQYNMSMEASTAIYASSMMLRQPPIMIPPTVQYFSTNISNVQNRQQLWNSEYRNRFRWSTKKCARKMLQSI